MKHTEHILKFGIPKEVIQDKRTTIEYLNDWINDLDNSDEELIAVWHLQQAVKTIMLLEWNNDCDSI